MFGSSYNTVLWLSLGVQFGLCNVLKLSKVHFDLCFGHLFKKKSKSQVQNHNSLTVVIWCVKSLHLFQNLLNLLKIVSIGSHNHQTINQSLCKFNKVNFSQNFAKSNYCILRFCSNFQSEPRV